MNIKGCATGDAEVERAVWEFLKIKTDRGEGQNSENKGTEEKGRRERCGGDDRSRSKRGHEVLIRSHENATRRKRRSINRRTPQGLAFLIAPDKL